MHTPDFRLPSMLILIAALCGCANLHQPASVQTSLSKVLHQMDGGDLVLSARVVDLSTGRELYASDPDREVAPASNMKLLSLATAVNRWTGLHPFMTYLAHDGDDLWLVGGGDPSLGDSVLVKHEGGSPLSVFKSWELALKSQHLTHFKGRLLYYDGAFDDQMIHPTWNHDDLSAWYAAPISGLNFNDNCIDVTAVPSDRGEPAKLIIMPPTTNESVVNHVRTGGRNSVSIHRSDDGKVFTVEGSCTQPTELPSKAITDPGSFAADALRTYLGQQGIFIDGPTTRASDPLDGQLEPPKSKLIAAHQTLMADMLPRIGKNSQNLFAEGLCKSLGLAYNQEHGSSEPGSWASGEKAIREFLKAHQIDDAKLVLADGSGLSHDNRVTARMISNLLTAMWKEPRFLLFRNSLTVGGVDGTIKSRFKDMPQRIYAKTGYIHGVRALSGYVINDDGHLIVFSFIYNGIPGSVEPVEQMQDEACRVLMHYPKMTYEPKMIQPTTTGESE